MRPSNYSVMWKYGDDINVGVLATLAGKPVLECDERGGECTDYYMVFHSYTREVSYVEVDILQRYHPFHDDHEQRLIDIELPYLHSQNYCEVPK